MNRFAWLTFAACLPIFAPAQERGLPVLSANLDALLNFTQLWQWSSEDFEKAYVVKLADPEQQEKPLGLSSVGCLLGFRRRHPHARRLSADTRRRLQAVQR